MNIIEEHIEREQYIEEVAAYIRVSTQEQKLHGISLEAQKEKLQAYADAHNMKIVEWYMDEGISGRKPIKKRPALQRMIEDAEKGKFKRIIFIKLDRFFRSAKEYHLCMDRLDRAKVIWTATEEKYDLSTSQGKMFVQMKITIAEFEANQTGDRIRMVNDYKIKSGQPLFGNNSMPFCYAVGEPGEGERHKYVTKRNEDVMMDLIEHILANHSVRAGIDYVRQKHEIQLTYDAAMRALKNEMLCGAYKGNENYCDPYIDRETFDRLQKIIQRNPRTTGNEHVYIFTGLIKCPLCGNTLKGGMTVNKNRKNPRLYVYRCNSNRKDRTCKFNKVVFENTMERMLLDEVEQRVAKKKANVIEMQAKAERVNKHNLSDLFAERDRLNYSFQKNRISLEAYDKRYDELEAKIKEATAENEEIAAEPDYSSLEKVFEGDWKEMYSGLEPERKRAFWRSFIGAIEIEWTTEVKRITDIEFF